MSRSGTSKANRCDRALSSSVCVAFRVGALACTGQRGRSVGVTSRGGRDFIRG